MHENGSELIRQVTSAQVGNKIKMCIFTSDKDIPGHVRLTTRTLQYLIIPLLSAALLVVGQLLYIKETMMMFPFLSLRVSCFRPFCSCHVSLKSALKTHMCKNAKWSNNEMKDNEFLILRILRKHNTALLSHVNMYVCQRRDISTFLNNLMV